MVHLHEVMRRLCEASVPTFDESGKPTFLVDYVKALEDIPQNVGIWIRGNRERFKCSACHTEASIRTRYCPYCGAAMTRGE